MRRSHLTLTVLSLLLSSSLLFGLDDDLTAQPFDGSPHGGPRREFFSSLTDEQHQTIQELIDQMRAEGSGPEEIHTAISELFAEWGLEMPERPGRPGNRRNGREGDHEGLWDDLTEDQRATLHSAIFQMWQDGATREEIHDAVAELLEGWGIELPDRGHKSHGSGGFDPGQGKGGHLFRGLMDQLRQEQREEIHRMIKEMRQAGVSQDEIRAAVEGNLTEWGIELPEPPPELTLEQRNTLHAVVFELWKGGSTSEEIRSAAAQQLRVFGFELPDDRPGWVGIDPLPDLRGCLRPSLTEQQHERVRQAIEELKKKDASPEEIHESMKTLMGDFGIQVPDLDSDLTDEQRAALRSTVFTLWLSGVSHSKICETVRSLLEDLIVELPQDHDDLESAKSFGDTPIQTQSHPNPANPETQIDYTLGESDDVKIQIYNISGQLVRTYDIGYQSRGSYSIRWDGCHQSGQPVASGIYFYRIQAGRHTVTSRIVLLR